MGLHVLRLVLFHAPALPALRANTETLGFDMRSPRLWTTGFSVFRYLFSLFVEVVECQTI